MAQKLNKDNFKAEVLDSNVPVLVDFFAAWCGPCRALNPLIEELSNEADGKYKICKVDADDNNDLCAEYNVNALPTLIVFKNGVEDKRMLGSQSKTRLLESLV